MISGPVQLSNQEARETRSTKQHMLGTLAVDVAGRRYRYASGGASDLVAANLMVAANPVANHGNRLVDAAVAAGEKKVVIASIGATALTADQYEDGYLVTQDNAGEGYSYLVDGHGAYDASASDVIVRLREAVYVALTTASEVTLEYNPAANVVISATDQADLAVGVAHVAVDVSEAKYFWLQTGGPCVVWGDETFASGAALTIGTGTAGQVEALDAAGEQQIGIAMRAGVDAEHTLAHLQLD